ncbi:hypothetical protein [Burkholderia sp. Ac-20353]|uniref:hypothetical protein n=1 Tax=Burkholderia sp. Ac-20353 TaxID=2703894 RepID=UPI00197CA9E7|nr:hypothetical protein [Burkholderia sp. Ac-20353]
MRRLLAIVLFVAGGFATEIAHPAQCSLISASCTRIGGTAKRTDERGKRSHAH